MTVLSIITLLVIVPAAVAVLSQLSLNRQAVGVGAPVVYRRQEVSTHPGPDAVDVYPSARGEFYYYSLIKYLRVVEVLGDGRVVAVERNNKTMCLLPNDSHLRKARLTERFLYHWRFPRL